MAADGSYKFISQRPSATHAANFTAWTSLGGRFRSRPAVVRDSEGFLHVFGRDVNDTLLHRSQRPHADGPRTKVVWGGWVNVGAPITSRPSAMVDHESMINVYARGQDRQLWRLRQVSVLAEKSLVRWAEWEPLGGVLASTPTLAPSIGSSWLSSSRRARPTRLSGSSRSRRPPPARPPPPPPPPPLPSRFASPPLIPRPQANGESGVAWGQWATWRRRLRLRAALVGGDDGTVAVAGRGVDEHLWLRRRTLAKPKPDASPSRWWRRRRRRSSARRRRRRRRSRASRSASRAATTRSAAPRRRRQPASARTRRPSSAAPRSAATRARSMCSARVGRGALGRQGDEQPSLRPPEPGVVAAAGDDAAAVGAARRRFGGAVAAVRRRVPDGGARGGAVGRQGDGRAAVRRALGVVGVEPTWAASPRRRPPSSAQTMAPPVRAPASAPPLPRPAAPLAPARPPVVPRSPRRLQRARRLFVRGGDGAINMRAEVRTGEGETGWAPWTSLGAPLGDEDVGVLRGRGWALVRENMSMKSLRLLYYILARECRLRYSSLSRAMASLRRLHWRSVKADHR